MFLSLNRSLFRAFCLIVLLLLSKPGWSQNLPSELVPSEVERLEGDKTLLTGQFPGLIYTPRNIMPVLETEYQQSFKVATGVYVAEKAGDDIIRYARRFIIYTPNNELLPTTKRVARACQLLHALYKAHLQRDHPRTEPTVEVWLMQQGGGVSAEKAGRQFKNQIYLFNILTDRTPTEWLREIAHEYGHYILPGVSGFTAPEEWGNGVLGEKLFLLWIGQEVQAGRLSAEQLPFAKLEELEEHLKSRIEPLLQRLVGEAISEGGMKRRDAEGMTYFAGAAIYFDSVYGSRALKDAFAYTESADGSIFIKSNDFYRGILKSLETANEIHLSSPAHKREGSVDSFMVYLPRGEFKVTSPSSVKRWEVIVGDTSIPLQNAKSLTVSRAGWRKIKFYLLKETQDPLRLTLLRRGAEVN